MSETKRLGRGLEALLGPVSREQAEASGALRELAMSSIKPNPFQPRTRMDEGPLDELVASIRASGLLQPVIVRPRNGGYELIAGERRWRAATKLGWTRIPAVVKDVDDPTLLTLALIENLQRDNLSPIDEAGGYQRLGTEFQLPQAEIARLVGRNRSTVANLLRLLQLPPEVQALVHERKLSEGHARALLALAESEAMISLARQAVDEGWSVREIEARVRGDGPAGGSPEGAPAPKRARPAQRAVAADARRVEDALRKHFGTDVRLTTRRRGRGFLTVSYYSNDDLARLLELILGRPFQG
ncbi:MAG TPA: ParB/RepB/Spo0J family partition protein [Gemmatimonadales bacterium]|nr:ParB/RepB/Spo0J family partition protein [Gemmatimonadales bacterium]